MIQFTKTKEDEFKYGFIDFQDTLMKLDVYLALYTELIRKTNIKLNKLKQKHNSYINNFIKMSDFDFITRNQWSYPYERNNILSIIYSYYFEEQIKNLSRFLSEKEVYEFLINTERSIRNKLSAQWVKERNNKELTEYIVNRIEQHKKTLR